MWSGINIASVIVCVMWWKVWMWNAHSFEWYKPIDRYVMEPKEGSFFCYSQWPSKHTICERKNNPEGGMRTILMCSELESSINGCLHIVYQPMAYISPTMIDCFFCWFTYFDINSNFEHDLTSQFQPCALLLSISLFHSYGLRSEEKTTPKISINRMKSNRNHHKIIQQ